MHNKLQKLEVHYRFSDN